MKKTVLLPDINVWVALSYRAHVHHADATARFAGLSNQTILFCRLTQQGYLRLSTKLTSVPGSPTKSSLKVISSDKPLSDQFIRPYAICETPEFAQKQQGE